MAHRVFKDSLGRTWNVWTVIPSRVERRGTADQTDWTGPDRRRDEEYRVVGPHGGIRWVRDRAFLVRVID